MLISLLIGIIIIAVILWLIGMLPLDARTNQIIRVVIIIIAIIWLIGLLTGHRYLGF